MKEYFTFDDVLLENIFSDINSRKDITVKTKLNSSNQGIYSVNVHLKLPVISANMKDVTGEEMAYSMIKAGGQAVLHRFCDIDDNIETFKKVANRAREPFEDFRRDSLAVSIGVGETERLRAQGLWDAGARIFYIDVARGASQIVVDQVVWLRKKYKKQIFIVVGNFCTAKTIKEFKKRSHGAADIFKVGIGNGRICETRVKTAVGRPQLSAIIECAKEHNIIADGGMKTPGDICIALAAGAKAVMLGGMLAGTKEAEGTWFSRIDNNGNKILTRQPDKEEDWLVSCKYSGSASDGYATGWKTSEGIRTIIPYKGNVSNILKDIEGSLRSSMSYLNALNLKEYRKNAKFIKITNNTVIENGTINENQ